jgi:hypothetical protein
VILRCSFEELSALNGVVERVLDAADAGGVAAPPQVIADIEALAPRLTGDIGVDSLADQRSIQRALEFLLNDVRIRMDTLVIEQHPAAEAAVLSYFDYAHVLGLADQARKIGTQMTALIEVMTGRAPTEETAARFSFPD